MQTGILRTWGIEGVYKSFHHLWKDKKLFPSGRMVICVRDYSALILKEIRLSINCYRETFPLFILFLLEVYVTRKIFV